MCVRPAGDSKRRKQEGERRASSADGGLTENETPLMDGRVLYDLAKGDGSLELDAPAQATALARWHHHADQHILCRGCGEAPVSCQMTLRGNMEVSPCGEGVS